MNCHICGFEARTPQGLSGHIRLAHPETSLAHRELMEDNPSYPPEPETTDEAIQLSRSPSFEEELEELIEGINRLEGRVGLLEEHTENSGVVLLRQVDQRLSAVKNDLERHVQDIAKGIDTVKAIQESSSGTVDHRLGAFEARMDSLGHRLQEFDRRSALIDSQVAAIQKLSERVRNVEQSITRLEGNLNALKQLAIRQPTGKLVTVALNNGREHTFKEYGSPEGLTRPSRHSFDLLLGRRWIDLAEPQD